MNTFITTHDGWIEEYRKDKYKIWIRATLSNGVQYYLPSHKDWVRLGHLCRLENMKVMQVGLQYRSHTVEVDTTDADGVYVVQSLIGTMGEVSRHTITIGKLYGSIVKKQRWFTPELIVELSDEDPIDKCFTEAMILNYENPTKE